MGEGPPGDDGDADNELDGDDGGDYGDGDNELDGDDGGDYGDGDNEFDPLKWIGALQPPR